MCAADDGAKLTAATPSSENATRVTSKSASATQCFPTARAVASVKRLHPLKLSVFKQRAPHV